MKVIEICWKLYFLILKCGYYKACIFRDRIEVLCSIQLITLIYLIYLLHLKEVFKILNVPS